MARAKSVRRSNSEIKASAIRARPVARTEGKAKQAPAPAKPEQAPLPDASELARPGGKLGLPPAPAEPEQAPIPDASEPARPGGKLAPAPEKPERAPMPDASEPAQPGGKLGVLVEHLATDAGATVAELAEATGWQRHTVHGALSRLRSRGFDMRLDSVGDRKAYRLVRSEA